MLPAPLCDKCRVAGSQAAPWAVSRAVLGIGHEAELSDTGPRSPSVTSSASSVVRSRSQAGEGPVVRKAVQGCRGVSQHPGRSQCLRVGRGVGLLHPAQPHSALPTRWCVSWRTCVLVGARWTLSAVCSCAVRAGWAHCSWAAVITELSSSASLTSHCHTATHYSASPVPGSLRGGPGL